MKRIPSLLKTLQRKWFEYQLAQLSDRQAIINELLLAAEMEARQLRQLHATTSARLASRRTAIRSKLIRL